jgi:hypothetical protein
MCVPKKDGGMGFRDLHAFNLAMLAKQTLRLLTRLHTLCAQVWKAKYYPNGDLLIDGPKSGSSFTWQIDSVGGQNLLRTVDELINPITGLWDEDLIRETFHPV